MSERLICQVYRSPRRDETYLYVDRGEGLARVPEALLEQFGKPEPSMVLMLTPERRMARVEASEVIRLVREQGFYLQMPPPRDPSMLDLYRAPTEGRY